MTTPAQRPQHLTPEQQAELRDILSQPRRWTNADIARHFGTTPTSIRRWAKKFGLFVPLTSRDARQVKLNAAALPVMRFGEQGAPPAEPVKPTMKTGATMRELAPITEADARRLIDEAIAKGVGARYEWRKTARLTVDVEGGVAYFEARGCQVTAKRKTTRGATMFQIVQDGKRLHKRPWLSGSEMSVLAGTMERQDALVRKPLNAPVERPKWLADKGGVNHPFVQYHDHPTHRIAGR